MASIDPLEVPIPQVVSGGISRLKGRGKHTLDSDEEDEAAAEEEEEAGVLPEEAIEGQEDGEACVDEEGTRFTAFNMREELEEGHFDSHGTYIFNKESELRDNWLDNIDWVQVKKIEDRKALKQKSGGLGDSSDSEDDTVVSGRVSPQAMRQQMLQLMRPGETVARAIRRLGGGNKDKGSGTLARLKAKKKSGSGVGDGEQMLKLSGLADSMVSSGDMDIYQASYEMLAFMVESANQKKEKEAAGGTEEPEVDMFADEDEPPKKAVKFAPEVEAKAESKEAESSSSSAVLWEYKVTQDSECVLGPFSSQQMLSWADNEEGFPRLAAAVVGVCAPQDRVHEVFVRRTGQDQAAFYSSKRIDFDLYI